MNDYLTMLVITAVTGVGGLALGGALATALHSPSDRSISLLLRFTAGVILSLVCFDLIADALGQAGIVPVICWIMIGCLCTYLLNCWIDRQAHHSHSPGGRQEQALLEDHGGHDHHSHHDREPLVRDNGEMCACGHHTLHTAGLVLAAAVALHNMPVGMAIGAAFAGPAQEAGHAGVLAAIIIGLHNVPEGMSIAAPLLTGGSRPAGARFWATPRALCTRCCSACPRAWRGAPCCTWCSGSCCPSPSTCGRTGSAACPPCWGCCWAWR